MSPHSGIKAHWHWCLWGGLRLTLTLTKFYNPAQTPVQAQVPKEGLPSLKPNPNPNPGSKLAWSMALLFGQFRHHNRDPNLTTNPRAMPLGRGLTLTLFITLTLSRPIGRGAPYRHTYIATDTQRAI